VRVRGAADRLTASPLRGEVLPGRDPLRGVRRRGDLLLPLGRRLRRAALVRLRGDLRLHRAARRGARLRVDEGRTRVVISEATRVRIDAEIAKYPKPRGALLPALHLVHAEHGYVSAESARELAA